MPEISNAPATRTASLHFEVGHKAAEGHFPGNPIIPGAVLLSEIVKAVTLGNAVRCREIRSAKFHQPVRPGDTLGLSWTEDMGGQVRFSGSIAGSSGPAVTGSLRLAPP